MGIKGAKKLLMNVCTKGVYRFNSMNDFLLSEKQRLNTNSKIVVTNPLKRLALKNKPYIVAIDTFLFASRYKRVFKKIDYGFLRQILLSFKSNIIPIYIFDGTAAAEKKNTIAQRQNKIKKNRHKMNEIISINQINNNNLNEFDKLINYVNELTNKLSNENNLLCDNHDFLLKANISCETELIKLAKKSISIDYNDIINLKKMFDILHIPYIIADGEADDLISVLYQNGLIDACQSDDMDMLPKGCGNMIQINKNGVTQFLLDEILTSLDLNHEQFIDFCILLGSDYYHTYLPRLKPMELLTEFKECKSLEQFVSKFSNNNPEILQHLSCYQNTRKSFCISKNDINKYFSNTNIILHNIVISLKNGPLNNNEICFKKIISHFNSININFNETNICKLKTMIKDVDIYINNLYII